MLEVIDDTITLTIVLINSMHEEGMRLIHVYASVYNGVSI